MKKKYLLIGAVIAVSATLLAACSPAPMMDHGTTPGNSLSPADTSAASDTDAYHKITAEEAKNMIDSDPDVTVVDVRRSDEYEEKHIEGSLLIPNETIQDTPPEQLPNKDAKILVHCRTGIRSKQASDKLVALGYTNIYDFGGINDWPYGTVSGPAETPSSAIS